MLSCDDPLPAKPWRVLIAGVTGVGKSTLGNRLGELWDTPYIQMDALHWAPDWITRAEFTATSQPLPPKTPGSPSGSTGART